MFNQIYTHIFIQLPNDIKNFLINEFSIPRTGFSEVRDNTLISDGHTNEDLQALSKEALEEFTVTKGLPFPDLWEATIMKVGRKLRGEDEIVEEVKAKKTK